MKYVWLILVLLLSMTSAFAQKSLQVVGEPVELVKPSRSVSEPIKIVEPIDCRLVRFSNPKDYEACCAANPKSCGGDQSENQCPKGWLETVKCGYGIDYENCSCLPAPKK